MFEKVRDFLLPYAEIDVEDIEPDTGLADLGIDSIKFYGIIADFEEQFGVKVSDKQLGELFKVQDLVDIVSK